MRDDIDVRLHDYHEHSREFAHVDRVKEEWAVNEKMSLSPTGEVRVSISSMNRTITVPESEARFLDGAIPCETEPFPIGDEL